MGPIRQATEQDLSRIGEILVFNNRANYYPIFQDEKYSFGEMQVINIVNEYLADGERMKNTFVYDDGVVRGMIWVQGGEVKKLFVEPFFQGRGVGKDLLQYAVERHGARFLWVLEKNVRAIRFYQRHGFYLTGKKQLEEGTTEYLVHMEREG